MNWNSIVTLGSSFAGVPTTSAEKNIWGEADVHAGPFAVAARRSTPLFLNCTGDDAHTTNVARQRLHLLLISACAGLAEHTF